MKRLYMVVVVDVDEDDTAFVYTMARQERLERLTAADIQHVVHDIGYTGHVHVLPSNKCHCMGCPGGTHYTPRVEE